MKQTKPYKIFLWVRIKGKVKIYYQTQDSQELLNASKEPNANQQRKAA